jgi:hypothetical protein
MHSNGDCRNSQRRWYAITLRPRWALVAPPHDTKTISNDDEKMECSEEVPFVALEKCPSISPERMLARLCQRVREVETLIHEELGDIAEPLDTLGKVLTPDLANQWKAAKEAYAQVPLECSCALARILSPFGQHLAMREHGSDATKCKSSLAETSDPGRCQASTPNERRITAG